MHAKNHKCAGRVLGVSNTHRGLRPQQISDEKLGRHDSEGLHGTKHIVHFLRVFGCRAYAKETRRGIKKLTGSMIR
jgi:hypothetical protein